MKHFLIYTNLHKDKGFVLTKRIQRYLLDRGQRCSIWTGETEKQDETGKQEETGDADCVIVLGGDGTMLQAAGFVREKKIPLVGVNLGTLGYMTEIEPDSFEQSMDRLIAGDYIVESRMMLYGRVTFESGKTVENYALNDIVISRIGSLQILGFHVYVNGLFLNDYHADGVIVTTPTGSTGYNLSAGGPIVEPGAKMILLTPICPHTLNQRSIILSPEDEVEIVIPAGRDGGLQTVEASFDGGNAVRLSTGDRINIIRADKTIEFIRFNQVNFLEILHKKLSGS